MTTIPGREGYRTGSGFVFGLWLGAAAIAACAADSTAVTSGSGGQAGSSTTGAGTGGSPSGAGGGTGNPGTGGTNTGGAGTTGTATGGRGGTGGNIGPTGTGGAGNAVGSGGKGGATDGGIGAGAGGSISRPDGGLGGTPGAVTFGPNIKLNDDTGGADQMETSISAGPNGELLVSWVDYRAGLNCGYTFSSDSGATWAKNFLIKPSGGGITGDATSAIGADGTMYAVCQDYGISQIRISTSIDKGATWSAPASSQSSPDKPWIGASPTKAGVLFISWLGSSAGVKGSMDGGKTWGMVHPLESLNHGTALMVGSTGVVHVPFSPNGGEIRYARSKDLGQTWEPTRTISQTGTFCFSGCGSRQNPIVSGGADPTGRYAAVAWAATYTGGDGNEDIWVTYTSDGGDTWTKPMRANDNKTASRQWQAWVAVDSYGRMHLVWSDTRNGKLDTYYARSLPDPTKGFEPNIKVNDKSGAIPSDILDYKGIAVHGDDVFVSFEDTRNGNNDIYFAKAPGAAGP